MKPASVEISTGTIVKTILLIVAILFLWEIRFILLLLLTSYIFMIGFSQLAKVFEKAGLNRTLAISLAYIFLLILSFLVIFLVLPPVIDQLRGFVTKIPDYLLKLNDSLSKYSLPTMSNQDLAKLFTSRIDSLLGNFLSFVFNTLNFLLNFFTVAVISFYLLLERDKLKNNFFRIFPKMHKERLVRLSREMEVQLGGWLKGELLLMLIVGLATYIGLSLLKVDYALPLAIIAGLLEAIPIIGPIIAAVPAVIITFTVSPIASLGVALLYILIQQIENNLLVPKIMKEVVGINPVLTIIAILIGAQFFGILGVILSVPVAAIVQVIILDFVEHPLDS